MEDIKAFMSITMYLLFIVVLFFYRKNDKSKKYIVFGVFYILCVALNFCSESMVNMIVFFLNRVSTQNICLESYEMLYFNVLTPIKEAILTYIIFDVVFEKKEKKIFSVDVIDKQSLKKENYEIIVQKYFERKSHNRIKCLEILKSSFKIKVYRHFSSKKRDRRIPQNIVTDF